MSTFVATIAWERGNQVFLDNRYSRRHVLSFDGGIEVPGSSSPHNVRVPLSDPTAIDPEETLVASLSSCHMLCFLAIAAKRRFRVDSYRDQAMGTMGKNAAGKPFVSVVTLHPEAAFSGETSPTDSEIVAMHHEAHEECFIANSVLTVVKCEAVIP